MLNLDVDLLRAFVAVADTGGFTSASRQLHRTQSAVSMQLPRCTGKSLCNELSCGSQASNPCSDNGYFISIASIHQRKALKTI